MWKEVNRAKVRRLFYSQVPVIVTVEFEGRMGSMAAICCVPLSFMPP
jgi:hypothetical protein